MFNVIKSWIAVLLIALASQAMAQITQKVIDIPTRPGVTQRMLVLAPPMAKGGVVLFAGGHGGLQIFPNGSLKWGDGNFLVRTRQLFADQGLMVAVVDAPSDRQSPPYLGGFRQKPEHVADIKEVIAWLREESKATAKAALQEGKHGRAQASALQTSKCLSSPMACANHGGACDAIAHHVNFRFPGVFDSRSVDVRDSAPVAVGHRSTSAAA